MPRASYQKPRHSDGGNSVCCTPRQIHFLHPGYRHDNAPFLALPAADGKGTLHHETARSACAIIAGNRNDGFLTEDRQGQISVGTNGEAELSRDEYYFQVPGEDGLNMNYEIFASFKHWVLPELPQYWKRYVIPPLPPHPMPRATATQVANRDISCRVTQCKEATQIAHIIPVSESEWYRSRGMSRYADFNDACNAILLKSDVHKIWDSQRFTIVPRLSGQEPILVTHVFGRNCSEEVVMLYHDVQLQPIYGVKPEFLFVRFAMTVFDSFVGDFLKQDVKRWLRIINGNGEQEGRLCSPQECRDYVARARSTSPTKRSRTGTSTNAAEDQDLSRKRSSSCMSRCSASLTELAEMEYEDNQCGEHKKRRTLPSAESMIDSPSRSSWSYSLGSTPSESPSSPSDVPGRNGKCVSEENLALPYLHAMDQTQSDITAGED